MLNQVPIDSKLMTGRFVEAIPAEFQGRQQERDGVPVWNVTLLVRPDGRSQSESVVVKVTSKGAPQIAELATVRLVNPYATFWQNGDRSGLSIRADEIVPVEPAISEPKAKPMPAASEPKPSAA